MKTLAFFPYTWTQSSGPILPSEQNIFTCITVEFWKFTELKAVQQATTATIDEQYNGAYVSIKSIGN